MAEGGPWVIRPAAESAVSSLASSLGIHPIVARIMVSRGLTSNAIAQDFINPSLHHLLSPFTQTDLEPAAVRLAQAVKGRESVRILGDYDVDGVTSTTLMLRFLRTLGVPVSFSIPDRLCDGYGVSAATVQKAAKDGVKLLVTVDCGITAHAEIGLARQLGMDVIVVDHHPVVDNTLPPATAVVDAHRADCGFANGVMAAAGAVFNLMTGLRQVLRQAGHFKSEREPNLRSYLDLVALGTVADMVPLVGQNRVLVSYGLKELAASSRPGIRALMEIAGCKTPVDSWVIGYQLAPRINAAGRLGTASRAVELLATDDDSKAYRLARELDQENRRRQELVEEIFTQAMGELEADPPGAAIVLARRGWHPGVLGIVASRIVEITGRPAVVVGLQDDGLGRGSARSVAEIDIAQALLACLPHLVSAGGHARAAGLTVQQDQVARLRSALCEQVESVTPKDTAKPLLWADAEVGLDQIDANLMGDLRRLEPHGQENAEPVLISRNLKMLNIKIINNRHLRCLFRANCGTRFGAIGFGKATADYKNGTMADVAFTPRWNDHGRTRKLELYLKDIKEKEKKK